MHGAVEDERDHAERGCIDKARREEEDEERAEEERKVVRLNAEHGDDTGNEHEEQRVERDLRAAVDLVRDPTADGAYARADERSEERRIGKRDLWEFAVDEKGECCGVADERAKSAGVDDGDEPCVLVAEDRHHAARTLLRDGQVVHEHPDEDEGECRRDRPEVADVLEVDLLARRVDERITEEPAEARPEKHGRGQVDERDTEVADAGVDTEGKSLLRLREEEADVCHRRGEVCACNADARDEQNKGVIGR